MNFYASGAFFSALSRTAFPGRDCRPALFQVGEHTFRLLVVDGKPLTRWPFLDQHEPVEVSGPAELRLLDYLPRAAVRLSACSAWDPSEESEDLQPSPRIDWTRFQSWAEFEAHCAERRGNIVADTRRHRRRIEREVGALRFTADDPREEVFAACLRWKSAQYVESGLTDLFADARNVALFRALREEGILAVASLSAGGVPVAVHLGARHDRRLSWWVPAYDTTFRRYAPGRLMLWALMEHSFHSGDREFDFLIGSEPYKWFFATDTRIVEPLGHPPLSLRAGRAAKRSVKRALQRFPWLWEQARQLQRAMR